MQIIGVVLCGGKSSRMGQDKGLIKKENVSWSEIAFRKLSQLSIPVVVSVNSTQYTSYQKIFSKEILVQDQLGIGGPLNGILSVHRNFPGQDLYVLACDIIQMQTDLLRKLYDNYILQQSNYDYFVYKNKDHFEPLCGMYTSHALVKISGDIQTGTLSKFSIKNILTNGKTFSLNTSKEDENSFLNYNEPGLLN